MAAQKVLRMKTTSLAWLNTACMILLTLFPPTYPLTPLQPPCLRTSALAFLEVLSLFSGMARPCSASSSLLTHSPVTKALSVLSSNFVFAKTLVSISC